MITWLRGVNRLHNNRIFLTCTYDEKGKQTTVSENAKIDPYRLLTVEDKIALAQEKRGCTIPPENQRTQIIKQAHERGHFGVTAIFRELSNKKIWWPKMMDEITSTIKQYTLAFRSNDSFSLSRSIRSAFVNIPLSFTC